MFWLLHQRCSRCCLFYLALARVLLGPIKILHRPETLSSNSNLAQSQFKNRKWGNYWGGGSYLPRDYYRVGESSFTALGIKTLSNVIVNEWLFWSLVTDSEGADKQWCVYAGVPLISILALFACSYSLLRQVNKETPPIHPSSGTKSLFCTSKDKSRS